MAHSPLITDAIKLELTLSLPGSHYARGIAGLSVFGYCTFGDGEYFENPQFINFRKQIFYPKNDRFTVFRFQLKPGVSAKAYKVNGQLEILSPTVQGAIINLLVGDASGLKQYDANGNPGPIPVIT